MSKMIKYILGGISWGCVVSCIVNCIGTQFLGYEWFTESGHSYLAQTIASVIVGIAWVVPSIVYESPKLAKGMQVLIHFTIGMVVFIPCAVYMGWMPQSDHPAELVLWIAIILIISLMIWCVFAVYYRKEAQRINCKIRDNLK